MNTLDKLKNIQAHIVKELTAGMKQEELLEGEDMLGIASVEIVDVDGDFIEIDAIDYSKYHNPPQRHLKILAQHAFSNADGTPAIVGRVERFFKTTVDVKGVETKALGFAFSFARDEEGELTPLAKAYKSLMPKYLDSFSVGMLVHEWDQRKDTGGVTVTRGELYEISAVSVPANCEANVLKEIKKAFKSQQIELKVQDSKKESTCNKDVSVSTEKTVETEPKEEHKEESNTSTDNYEDIKTFINDKFDALMERIDTIESAISVMSEGAEQTDAQEDQPAENIEAIKQIQNALEKIKGLNTQK